MSSEYLPNRVRGPLNAFIFTVLDPVLDHLLKSHKSRVFADLPDEAVELGPGVGANLRYLPAGSRVIAIEPNPAMHARLRSRAGRRGIELDLRSVIGERIDLDDAVAPAVISSLVLCTVRDPAQVLAEVLRILRPGGSFAFVEHVAAAPGSMLRRLQHRLRRPWGWVFEGCSCERDLAALIERAGFAETAIERYRLRSPFLPFNTQIAGIATKAD